MLLLLIRHGVTPHVGKKLSGWSAGVSLSKDGRAQSDRLVQRLDGVRLDAIYSSPLERAQESAAPLARARKLRVRTRPDIGEVKYGAIEGRSLKALAKTDLWRKLRAWPSDVRFERGESLRETQARAVAAIEQIRAAHKADDVAAVFSHGDWIRLSMAHYLGVHIDLYQRIVVEPASISAIRFFEHGPIVLRLNDTGELSGLAPIPTKA